MMSTLNFHYHHHGYGCLCNLPHSDPLKFGNADEANQQLVCVFPCLYSICAYVSESKFVVECVLGSILAFLLAMVTAMSDLVQFSSFCGCAFVETSKHSQSSAPTRAGSTFKNRLIQNIMYNHLHQC